MSRKRPSFIPVLESMTSNVARQRIRLQLARSRHEEVFLRNQNNGIMDIHNYSATSVDNAGRRGDDSGTINNVQDDASDTSTVPQPSIPNAAPIGLIPTPSPTLRNKPNTLNASILDIIDRRIGEYYCHGSNGNTLAYSMDQVSEILSEILTSSDDFSPSQQETAVTYMESFLNSESVLVIGRCLRFLETLEDPNVFPLWLKGFIGESIQMNSCRQGAIERCVTGLRGIGDNELDDLFKQAEGPHLARIFLMSVFNIYDAVPPINGSRKSRSMDVQPEEDHTRLISNEVAKRATERARNLAKELVARSIRPGARIDQVEKMLVNYARESLVGFMVDPDSPEFREQIEAVVSTVVDLYDDVLNFFVEEYVNNQQQVEVREL